MLSTGRAYDLLCVHDEALIDQRHVALLAREALVVPVAFFKAHKLSATLTNNGFLARVAFPCKLLPEAVGTESVVLSDREALVKQ